jgi:hypothetical protein
LFEQGGRGGTGDLFCPPPNPGVTDSPQSKPRRKFRRRGCFDLRLLLKDRMRIVSRCVLA